MNKTYIRNEGLYLFTKEMSDSIIYLGEGLLNERVAHENKAYNLLLLAKGQSPTVIINHKTLVYLTKSSNPLRIFIAVSSVSHQKLVQKLTQKDQHPSFKFTLNPDDPVRLYINECLKINPNPKYHKKLIYTWNDTSECDDFSFADNSSLQCRIDANCSKRITGFSVSNSFLSLIFATGRGLAVSILNERYGASC